MFDLIILFTLFLGLVGLLALVHQWEVSGRPTQTHTTNLQLLNEWLQAHKLELPGVPCLLSVINRKLQEVVSEVSPRCLARSPSLAAAPFLRLPVLDLAS